MKNEKINRFARRFAVLGVAAFAGLGVAGPSAAESSSSLAGSWSGSGWVSFANGNKERARCQARYSGGGDSYTLTATCATASGKASQTAQVYKVSGSVYKGSFVNSDYNVHGTIRVKVNGNSQSVSLSGDGAAAQISLSRR
jgi:hypothetical protein